MPRLSLTSKLVDNAPLPRDRKSVEYFDQRMPGLVLRVSSRGTKSWNAVYRHHGHARRASPPHCAAALARVGPPPWERLPILARPRSGPFKRSLKASFRLPSWTGLLSSA